MNLKLPKDVLSVIREQVNAGFDAIHGHGVPESDFIFDLADELSDKIGDDQIKSILLSAIGAQVESGMSSRRTAAVKARQGNLFSTAELDVVSKSNAGNLYKEGDSNWQLRIEKAERSSSNRILVDEADDHLQYQNKMLAQAGMDKDPDMSMKDAVSILAENGIPIS